MKILSYHHSSTSPLHTPNSRAYTERCHTHGDQAYLLETWTKPSKLNQHFGIQLITESRLRDSTSTYLFTSAGSCASFITALPQFHLCNRHVKHFQTLGWHYPDRSTLLQLFSSYRRYVINNDVIISEKINQWMNLPPSWLTVCCTGCLIALGFLALYPLWECKLFENRDWPFCSSVGLSVQHMLGTE